MLNRLPPEIICHIASFTRTVHNGVSIKAVKDESATRATAYRLYITVSIADERVRLGMSRRLHSGVKQFCVVSNERGASFSRNYEFDILQILMSIRLPRGAHACNWCYNTRTDSGILVSFGVEETSPALRSVCSGIASAIVDEK